MSAIRRLYAWDTFGYDTGDISRTAISQSQDSGELVDLKETRSFTYTSERLWFVENNPSRNLVNALKIVGYIPGLNLLSAALLIYRASTFPLEFRPPYTNPHLKTAAIVRGVAMVFLGPLLAIVDLVKFIFDCIVVSKYNPILLAALHQSYQQGYQHLSHRLYQES